MGNGLSLQSADAFQSAFRVRPEVAAETARSAGVGFYSWKTPPMDGFELPASDELIVALHLGGSRRVRAITDGALSRAYSAPGLLTVLPPGRCAAFRTDGSISLVSLHIPGSTIAAAPFGPSIRRTPPPRFAFRDAFASAAMEALLRAARSGRADDRDYVAKLADALLCHLGRSMTTDEASPGRSADAADRLGRARLGELLSYVDEHLGSKLSVDELACRAGLSRAAFTRDFRLAMGASFHAYLNVRRVEAAKKLLRGTDLKLAFIAQEQGFSSQSHFASVFKALVNCTPNQFRERH